MIGKLDQKIALERQVRTPDGGGGQTLDWVPFPSDPKPWAKVELKGGGEVAQGGGTVAKQRALFTIRARSDLRASDRILWGDLVWNIVSVGRPVARARYQVIEAVAGELSA
uniref:head-tail adaptor protein n=1 Tax=Ruegeria arenilitoris TaxID=1173585 RepID=UPI001479BDF9|nr:head-tail adaptor protein [Ruegeria arenilitoris]